MQPPQRGYAGIAIKAKERAEEHGYRYIGIRSRTVEEAQDGNGNWVVNVDCPAQHGEYWVLWKHFTPTKPGEKNARGTQGGCKTCALHRRRKGSAMDLSVWAANRGLVPPADFHTRVAKYTWTCQAAGHQFVTSVEAMEGVEKRRGAERDRPESATLLPEDYCHHCYIGVVAKRHNMSLLDAMPAENSLLTEYKWQCDLCPAIFFRRPGDFAQINGAYCGNVLCPRLNERPA